MPRNESQESNPARTRNRDAQRQTRLRHHPHQGLRRTPGARGGHGRRGLAQARPSQAASLPPAGGLPRRSEKFKRRLATASRWPYGLVAINVAIEIPENVSAPLRLRWKDVPRRVLEAVAAEAYRSGALTAHQVGELLGHGSRWETESFLKRVQAYLHYSEDDLERDLAVLRSARG